MPPVQASIDSQYFFVDNYDVVILTCAILSFIIFALVVFLAWQSISRRFGIHGKGLRRPTTSSVLRSPRARKARKEALFPPAISALVVQSTLVASHPLRLGVVPGNLWPSSAVDIISHGLAPVSWGRANIKQFGLTASTPNGDGSRIRNTICLLPAALRGLRRRQFFGLFAGLPQQAPNPGARESQDSHSHAPGVVEATDDPDPDVLEPDAVHIPKIFLSTDDAQFETGTLPIPLIILSLPSSEHLVEGPSLPVSLDEDLLSPDGTFHLSGRPARVAVQTYDISDATRLALASRLRRRQKMAVSFPSPDVLASRNVVRWPRWL